ncbi:MAG: flagellar basal body L-ring protein FlgH [Armatimonadetes bacterium]|jgi:flagellar L-ring protein precursor FlgH|nr:flagellar basal body L-ring protein FlgH [Armatimonadota bacterium]
MRRVCLALLVACASPVCGDSLWPSEGARPAPLVTDSRAHRAGDLLTVLIVETAAASQQANTQTEKKHGNTVSPSTGILKFLPEVGFSDTHKYSGQGSTSRSTSLTARMTVQVTMVHPDGSLEIEGKRSVTVNNERQELRLKGRVRPQDVSADNTVLSSLIADAQISYSGKGVVGSTQKPGIITRILRLFF